MRVAWRSLDERAIEWYSALVMMSWGATLAMPGDTLSAPAFAAFSRYGVTEDMWAAAFCTAGGARIIALYINGRWPRTPYVRIACSLFASVSWAQIGWLLFEGSYLTTGTFTTGPLTYALLALFDIISVYRAAFDARYNRP
jgi:hypothetical protein